MDDRQAVAMTRAKDAIGAYGERVAVAYLLDRGMAVLERNWRGAAGEVDIIARDRDILVICEVKTRSSDACGAPIEAVGPAKARRLRRLAAQWLTASGLHPREVRFDVISVRPQLSGPAHIEHHPGAF